MAERSIAISEALANRMIEAVGSTVSHNINIMNAQGVIIASRDPARVGRFHEVAYQILHSPEDMLETYETNKLLGTHRGVNIAIRHGGEKIGVLGITGHPDEVKPLVLVMKLAVETMLEYDLDQRAYVLRYTQRQQLEACLVHGAFAEESKMNHWAGELALQTDIYRIPLLFRLEKQPEGEVRRMLTELLAQGPQHHYQDIVTDWYGKEIIVFKAVDAQAAVSPPYARQSLAAFAQPFQEACTQQGITAWASTGFFTSKLSACHRSLQKAQWLMTLPENAQEPFRFFYDYIRPWVDSHLPMPELRDAFDFYRLHDCSETFIRRMVAACGALRRSGYNFVKASQALFIHKNTLFSWMNDVRQKLHIDPVQNETDRAFWEYLCRYYEQQ